MMIDCQILAMALDQQELVMMGGASQITGMKHLNLTLFQVQTTQEIQLQLAKQ